LYRAPDPPELLVVLKDELVIGRSPEADVVLRHPTVSNVHARVVLGPQHVTLEDLGSRNHTLLRGHSIRQASLADGDTVRIGPWSLEYCEDLRRERHGRDRRLDQLPRRLLKRRAPPDSLAELEAASGTFMADADTLKRLARRDERRVGARLVREGGGAAVTIGPAPLTVGPVGDVVVGGAWWRRHDAVLRWAGHTHLVERHGWFGRLKVNGDAVQQRALRTGDRIVIGNAVFRYQTV
jgi:pSer/pThr/pTyr-binding forkhead associated (FHA) protein